MMFGIPQNIWLLWLMTAMVSAQFITSTWVLYMETQKGICPCYGRVGDTERVVIGPV